MNFINKFFKLKEFSTDLKTEITGGLTTFLTMSYIIFVQPQVLGAAGMDKGAVFTATCLSSAIACFIMGIYANYPIAQAPLIGENFFFAYTVVLAMGLTWQKALGLVFISGIVFLLLTMTKIREKLIDSVPDCLKFAIASGIGLFITLIGLKESGLIVANPPTFVKLGDISSIPVLISSAGLIMTATLFARNIKGGILFGMLFSAIIAYIIMGFSGFSGIFSLPPSMSSTFLKLDLTGILNWDSISIILIFLFMSIFDTLGTLVGVGIQAGLIKNGKFERISKALVSDAVATTCGSLLGTSTVSSYIESSTGVANGGRTGLTAITVGFLFLLSLFFAPLVSSVNLQISLPDKSIIHPVTAPALIFVGALMMSTIKHIKWEEWTDSIPAFLTLVLIPFTFNIADGIAFGFISFVLLKTLSGKTKEVSLILWILALLFLSRYIFLVS
jgi:AGZA family xanthine/uracil permease-like MFS transporter